LANKVSSSSSSLNTIFIVIVIIAAGPRWSVAVYTILRQRQVWLIPLADETKGVQEKLCYPSTMRAIPERLRDVSCIGATHIILYIIFLATSYGE